MKFSSIGHTVTYGRLGWLGFPAKKHDFTANFEQGKYLRDRKTALWILAPTNSAPSSLDTQQCMN